jgi:1,2-diacylglycerol 3-beta-glucosyltransferase
VELAVVHLDLTVLSYAIFAIVIYYASLFALSALRRPPPRSSWAAASGAEPFVVLVIPAHNEELVLDRTLSRMRVLQYSGSYRILTINDASTDLTSQIAHNWADLDSRIRVIDRTPQEGGRGKSEVLNHAYRTVLEWCRNKDEWLEGRREQDIVLGIVDADGSLAVDCLDIVSRYFSDESVGSTQIGVRIGNADSCTLTRMQDMEFVGFSWFVQIARDHLGSVGLGGNGQFTRLAALKSLRTRRPWAPGALTEDLDLGLRLVEAGWAMRFCHLTYVEQQGLNSWRPLLRQRTRWIQGHYQCWKHIPTLLRSSRRGLLGRIDLIMYLLLVVVVMVVTAAMMVNILAAVGLIQVTDGFFDFLNWAIVYRGFVLTMSVLPVLAFTWTYQRNSLHPFRWYEVPAYAIVFTLYTYVWVIATLRAWARIVLGRNGWVKTPRVAPTHPLNFPLVQTSAPLEQVS